MEQIYLGGFPRAWHSDKVELNDYFEKYSEEVNKLFQGGKSDFQSILKAVLPDSVSLGGDAFSTLNKLTSIGQLRTTTVLSIPVDSMPISKLTEKQIKSSVKLLLTAKKRNIKGFHSKLKRKPQLGQEKRSKFRKRHRKSNMINNKEESLNNGLSSNDNEIIRTELEDLTSMGREIYDSEQNSSIAEHISLLENINVSEVNKMFGNKHPVQTDESIFLGPDNILLDNMERTGRKTLKQRKDFYISFRVHEPFYHSDVVSKRFSQEIRLLSHQTLEVLRDKIICKADFQDTQGDLSDNPDGELKTMTKDMYKSAMFYLDNTFYTDGRHRGNIDYSKVIRKWAESRGIAVGSTVDMRELAVGKLSLRFGYPYLYMHQGCCEHLIVVNDARLLSAKDSLYARDYPLMSNVRRQAAQCCVTCLAQHSRWVVCGSDQLLHDISTICDSCHRQLHYKDGKKLGSFKAYRYCAQGMLL